jgi:predicted PurR-regulated permease PerM
MEPESNNAVIRAASAFFIIGCILLLIYLGSDILFPLIMALLFAILLRPISNFFNEKLKLPNIIAIGLTVLLALCVMSGVVLFMSQQIAEFMNDLPTIKRNLNQNVWHVQNWIYSKFGMTISEQKTYIDSTMSEVDVISPSSVSTITNGVMYMILIPIYTFLILNYRSLLLGFFLKLVAKKDIESLQEIVTKIKSVIRSYITGLLIEVVIVASLTSLGLWIIGVPYFIFLGVLTAFLNLIPYIGIMAACTISAFIAISGSTDPTLILAVIVVNVIVQFIDNNILIPMVVGSKVSVNALTSMVGVIVGGSLAGIAGMFLAIPMIAILKVIFDHSPTLKPYGYLMGDTVPKSFDWNKIRLPVFYSKSKDSEDNKQE